VNYKQEARKLGRGFDYEISGDGRYALVVRRGRSMTITLFAKAKDAMQKVYNSPSVKDYVFDLETEERV